MTRQRVDGNGTQFGLWLRKQPELESRQTGFVAFDIDYVINNYKSKKFMLLEEKRNLADVSFAQYRTMRIIHDNLVKAGDKMYCGMFLLQFSNSSPDDSQIILINRNIQVDRNRLIRFLSMDWFNPGQTKVMCFNPPERRLF